VQVLQNSNFFLIYMKEKEKGRRLIKISRSAMRQPQVSHASFFCFFFHLLMCFSQEANLREHKVLGSNFCWNFLCNLFFRWWPLGWLHEACSVLNFKVNLLLWTYVFQFKTRFATELKWMVLDLGLLFVFTSIGLKW
jgi:hypothetical protein